MADFNFAPLQSFSRAYTASVPPSAAPNRKAKNSNGHEKNSVCVARGLKAAIHNPHVSAGAKEHAAQQLKEMDDEQKKEQIKSDWDHARHQLGYKAALTNKRTSPAAKENARKFLDIVANGESKNENRVMGGYKAVLKNRYTSPEAKEQAKKVLEEHGVKL